MAYDARVDRSSDAAMLPDDPRPADMLLAAPGIEPLLMIADCVERRLPIDAATARVAGPPPRP